MVAGIQINNITHNNSHIKPYVDDVSTNDNNAQYPSYLMLNNWVNSTILVYTGIQDNYISAFGSPVIYDFSLKENLSSAYITLNEGNVSTEANLNENNTIEIKQAKTSELLYYGPQSDQLLIKQDSYTNFEDLVNVSSGTRVEYYGNQIKIFTNPILSVSYTNATISFENKSGIISISLNYLPGSSSLSTVIGNGTFLSISKIISNDEKRVSEWLNSSSRVKLPPNLYEEYNMSLLLVKDDQNPWNGEFTASPSPIYLYAWARDGSFAAMSMMYSGHIHSAVKYWTWMSHEQSNNSVNGTWETRFNFWTGAPDTSWISPEYDSVGLFEIGIYDLFEITGNKSLVIPFLNTVNNSLKWEEKSISKTGLIPEDYSIWEDVYAYNFWTQAIDEIGMSDILHLYSILGLNTNNISSNITILKTNILKYFTQRDDTIFAEYATPTTENGHPGYPYPFDIYDSSSLLPIAMGLISPSSAEAKRIVSHTIANLSVEGGLARFYGDTYHFEGYPDDSSGPMPPWIITTMFEAFYDETVGNNSGALSLMNWAQSHSQSGLLPEALDPHSGVPLPSTSPLTWSSAMFVLVAVNYETHHMSSHISFTFIYIIVPIIIIAGIATYMYKRKIKQDKG
ncbi:MAG: hypothetical protein QXL01_02635 [Thermoplasmatales archaeon]